MASWFASGRFVYFVFGCIAFEGALLLWLRLGRGRGPRPAAIVANLAAGGLIFAALERALSGAHWGWVALFAAASLPAHLLDLRLRWPATPVGRGAVACADNPSAPESARYDLLGSEERGHP